MASLHVLLKHLGVQQATKEEEWASIDSLMCRYASSKEARRHGVKGMALNVYNKDGVLAHRFDTADVSNQRLHVASVSKLVSGLILMACVTDGDIRLEDTTGKILGWEGDKGKITLDNLGSMTSGLVVDDDSMYRDDITLAQCVDIISKNDLVTPPGFQFYYKSTDWHVAARMAELATGKTWNELFDEKIKKPLGLMEPDLKFGLLKADAHNPTHDFLYGRKISFVESTENPLPAGGLHATASEIHHILHLVQNNGRTRQGERIIKSECMKRMFTNKYVGCKMFRDDVAGSFVLLGFKYGFGCWLESDFSSFAKMGKESQCFNSLGIYGSTPWIDKENEYYAIISMEGTDAKTCNLSYQIKYKLQSSLARTVSRHYNGKEIHLKQNKRNQKAISPKPSTVSI